MSASQLSLTVFLAWGLAGGILFYEGRSAEAVLFLDQAGKINPVAVLSEEQGNRLAGDQAQFEETAASDWARGEVRFSRRFIASRTRPRSPMLMARSPILYQARS